LSFQDRSWGLNDWEFYVAREKGRNPDETRRRDEEGEKEERRRRDFILALLHNFFNIFSYLSRPATMRMNLVGMDPKDLEKGRKGD